MCDDKAANTTASIWLLLSFDEITVYFLLSISPGPSRARCFGTGYPTTLNTTKTKQINGSPMMSRTSEVSCVWLVLAFFYPLERISHTRTAPRRQLAPIRDDLCSIPNCRAAIDLDVIHNNTQKLFVMRKIGHRSRPLFRASAVWVCQRVSTPIVGPLQPEMVRDMPHAMKIWTFRKKKSAVCGLLCPHEPTKGQLEYLLSLSRCAVEIGLPALFM